MTTEVLERLAVRDGGSYIDCTLGDAGHGTAILDASAPSGRLLGLDADPDATAFCRARLTPYGPRASVVNANFESLEQVASAQGFTPADGILFDLGLASRQLEAEGRGFSFRRADPLDMRFNPSVGPSAADLVNTLDETALANMLFRLGGEPRSRRIARAIVAARPIADTARLAQVVAHAAGYGRGRTHPATRVFMALRMAVNRELDVLADGLAQAERVLASGGRLVTIAYHSGEDRVIKEFIRARASGDHPTFRPTTKGVVTPTAAETQRNRRSRSAKLRACERLS